LVIGVGLVSCESRVNTDIAEPSFLEANKAFNEGNYEAAIQAYMGAIDAAGSYTDVFAFNLGNAHYRNGDAGSAALWYSRALRFNPGFSEALQNLQVIDHTQGSLRFERSWAAKLGGAISPSVVVVAGSMLLWLAAIMAAFIVRSSRSVTGEDLESQLTFTRFLGPILLAAFGLIVLIGVYPKMLVGRSGVLGDSVVVATNVSARNSPSPSATKVIDLPAGSELKQSQSRGAWTYVKIPGDLHGWVESKAIEAIAAPE